MDNEQENRSQHYAHAHCSNSGLDYPTGSPLGYYKPPYNDHKPTIPYHTHTNFPSTYYSSYLQLSTTTIMTQHDNLPVTRIACFKFHPTVTPTQKGDRTRAFLALYAQHEDLILEMPKGGKPLNTPLNLTNVKREKEWDTGFVVKFKV